MLRSDLDLIYNDPNVWKYSFFIGVEFDFGIMYYKLGNLFN